MQAAGLDTLVGDNTAVQHVQEAAYTVVFETIETGSDSYSI